MITVGPYQFTTTDARRTIEHFATMWHQFELGRPDAEAVLADLVTAQANARSVASGDLEAELRAVFPALMAAGPALRAAGALPQRAQGIVDSLHVSDGGVPKTSVDQVEVGWSGVVGDRQATRVHHGRPWQALCLWSGEVIDHFAAAGHALVPGAAGENITLRGIEWSDVRPGVRLRLGTVECDVIAFTLPCRKNARWFRDREFDLMHHDRGPVSRVYAVVTRTGRIARGDAAVLEP
jgi:hypothetical protein